MLWLSVLRDLEARHEPSVLATVVEVSGSSPCSVGVKMIVTPGEFWGTIGGGHLEQLALENARTALREGQSARVRYPLGATVGQCCGGVVEIFFEVLFRSPRLYLFGAGHVGQALCRVLLGTAFTVEAIDERPEWIGAAELPPFVIRHAVGWDEFIEQAEWSAERTYVAVMTHRHDWDQAIVEQVIRKQTRYIGLIGSDLKWRRFRDRLIARGVDAALLDRVHCPIGLDIGGKAPGEVAISAAAELLRDHYKGPARGLSPLKKEDEPGA
jgi:xanthine dehydrogenase accessory factor